MNHTGTNSASTVALFFALASVVPSCRAPAEDETLGVAAAAAAQIRPFNVGECLLGADHVLGAAHSADERVPFVIYSFLVETPDGRSALIDLGPKSLEYTNRMFRHHGFFRDLGAELPPEERYPDDVRQPYGNIIAQLEATGRGIESIDHIVFTHLHADHHGMHDARDGGVAEESPNALLHVSRRGWEDNLARRDGERWNSYVDYAFADFLLRREAERKVRFEDDAEIFPGLRTLYLGGHSICSQAVVVDTDRGPVIISSDDIYLYRLLENAVLPEIRTTPENLRSAVRRIVDLARRDRGIIVPLHDPIVWRTYARDPAGWPESLREHSDRAIAGYLARQP